MKQYLVLLFSLFCIHTGIAQNYLAEDEYYHRLTTGLSVMLIKDPGASDIAVNLTFKTGAYTEVDSVNGFNYLYSLYFLLKNEKDPANVNDVSFLNDRQITFSHQVGQEEVTYQFLLKPAHLEDLLNFLEKTLMTRHDTVPHVELVKAQNNADFYQYVHDSLYASRMKISHTLWETYQSRMQVFAPLDSSDTNLGSKLKSIEDSYYCPGNALLVIKGDINVRTTKTLIQTSLLGWDPCRFYHLYRYPIPDHNYYTYSRQMVFEVEVSEPFFTLTFQGPSFFKDARGQFTALLFEEMLADTNTQLYQYLVDSTYIKHTQFETNLSYYANEARLTVIADSTKYLDSARIQLYQLLNQNKLFELASDQDIEKAKQQLINKFEAKKEDPLQAALLVSKFWASSNIDYYSMFDDSVLVLNHKNLKKFNADYLMKAPHISALYISATIRDSLATDTFFAPTAGYVDEYQFLFLKNTGDFANAAQDSILQSLAQYLKINPRVKVKITGQVAKNELMQVRDTDMQCYLDSLENLHIYPKSTVKGAKVRLDIYRALTIIRKLDEAGVPKDQLFGEGIVAKKPHEMETAQTAYCTLLRTIQLRED